MRGGLVRLTIGFASRVAAGKGRGSAARPFREQLVQRFGKNSARKPRYPTTRASFRRVIAGCFSVVGRIPRSGSRPIRGRPAARAFPRGILRFSCQDLPRRLYFFGPLSTAFAQQACPRAGMQSPPYRGSSDCWRFAFPTPFPDSWRAFKVRPRSYFGRLSSSSRKSSTDIVKIPSLS